MAERKRIISLDVIRAFALLGILMVHVSQYYGFNNVYNNIPQTDIYLFFKKAVSFLLDSKMRNMLSLLFGITFYFLMSKPDYTVMRFCKRCFVLMAFGLINVSFYTTDILLWFGLNGLIVCLSYVWKLKAKWMLVLGLFLILMGPVTNNFLREILFPDINISQRYLNNTTITDIITYPFVEVLKGFIRTFAGTSTLGYMIVGYSLAQMGYAFRLDQIANIKIALICTVTYFIVYLILRATGTPLLISIWHLTGVALYMILIVIASHKLHFISGLMGKYGKMTLTHYTCQEVLMPCIMPLLIIPNHMDFVLLLIVGLLLYTFQVLFSYYWLQVHKYGPLEYLWRKCS